MSNELYFHDSTVKPPVNLEFFVRESNRIEGIHKINIEREIEAHERLLSLDSVTIGDLLVFVEAVQPGAVPRFTQGRDVRVGEYFPPKGGPHVLADLGAILDCANEGAKYPYEIHIAYEKLHPFTDGNGRSGRALWLWCMGGIENAPLGFLHHFYYQTLQQS